MKKNSENISKTDRKYATILNIRVDSTSEGEVIKTIGQKLVSGQKFYIVTPNPDIILQAQKDRDLAKSINSSDISIADGTGLRFADPNLKIIHGRKLVLRLCREAARNNWKVFFLGGLGNEVTVAAKNIKSKFPKIKIQAEAGPKLGNNATPVSEVDIKKEIDAVYKINRFAPQVLFIAFGAPKQEKWILRWLPKLNIGGAMAVGGTFRYLAGYAPIPPKWIEALGLEWLWRLVSEPDRLGRIINSVIIFPLRVVFSSRSRG